MVFTPRTKDRRVTRGGAHAAGHSLLPLFFPDPKTGHVAPPRDHCSQKRRVSLRKKTERRKPRDDKRGHEWSRSQVFASKLTGHHLFSSNKTSLLLSWCFDHQPLLSLPLSLSVVGGEEEKVRFYSVI